MFGLCFQVRLANEAQLFVLLLLSHNVIGPLRFQKNCSPLLAVVEAGAQFQLLMTGMDKI